jgi:hypothetical protein
LTDANRINWLAAIVVQRDIVLTTIPDGGIEVRLSQGAVAVHVIRATLRDALDAAIEASKS